MNEETAPKNFTENSVEFSTLQETLATHFKWFHSHPELGLHEWETTARIRDILMDAGVKILDTGLETGLVARIGGSGTVVALRCDIDALPIAEATNLEYASKNGCMHACGHDFHLTSMLGAASLLKQRESRLMGAVKLVFQPAEESVNGAVSVLASGALDDVAEIYGLHTTPDMPVSMIGVSSGAVYAAVGSFAIRIHGKSGHAAHPDECRDPIVALSQIIGAAQTIVSRRTSPFDPAVLSFTHVEAGNTWNIIPEEAFAEGTIRVGGKERLNAIMERLKRVCKGVEEICGARIDFHCELNAPAVNNDSELAEFVKRTAQELGFKTGPSRPTMGGEDFAFYQERIRGVFWNIGVASPEPAHNPRFIANPAALSTAAALLSAIAEKSLKRLSSVE
ncbi:MAG: amidohydrolase [Treponema sp.]|jgi:amidohydrolase|nr:amidohydrolase [Treponema sp.]